MVARRRGRRIRSAEDLPQKDVDHLRMLDFLGQLSPEEEVLAKKLGIFKWNDFVKAERARLGRRGKVKP